MFNFMRKGKIEYIVTGLGNPGSRYEDTRHNVGFMALDRLAAQEGFSLKKFNFHALIADEMIGGKRCLLMKPQTMMNLSGEAVVEAADYYGIDEQHIIVLFDDISLDVGKTRIRRKGSAGGHNGIKSIISCLGSEEFPRVKIGVGKKPHPEYELKDWVLSSFSAAEQEALAPALENAAEAVRLMVQGETDRAMNQFNA